MKTLRKILSVVLSLGMAVTGLPTAALAEIISPASDTIGQVTDPQQTSESSATLAVRAKLDDESNYIKLGDIACTVQPKDGGTLYSFSQQDVIDCFADVVRNAGFNKFTPANFGVEKGASGLWQKLVPAGETLNEIDFSILLATVTITNSANQACDSYIAITDSNHVPPAAVRPAKVGYTQKGWLLKPSADDAGVYYNLTQSIKVFKPMILNAQYNMNPFMVTFVDTLRNRTTKYNVSKEGVAPKPDAVYCGDPSNYPIVGTKVFAGWKLENGDPVTDLSAIHEATTLYAYYEELPHQDGTVEIWAVQDRSPGKVASLSDFIKWGEVPYTSITFSNTGKTQYFLNAEDVQALFADVNVSANDPNMRLEYMLPSGFMIERFQSVANNWSITLSAGSPTLERLNYWYRKIWTLRICDAAEPDKDLVAPALWLGGTHVQPDAPTRAGYDFTGWTINSTTGTPVMTPFPMNKPASIEPPLCMRISHSGRTM